MMILSIIIPMYNSEKTIADSLYSIFKNQKLTANELEVIVIDDKSTDQSREIVEEWTQRSDCNIVILDGVHEGVSAARNLGLKFAQGKYITFLDSDDTFSKNDFKPIIQFFNSQEGEKTDIVSYTENYVYEYPVSHFVDYGFPKDYQRYNLVQKSDQSFIYQKIVPSAKNVLYSNGKGIYPADLFYYIAQARLNVVIRNLPESGKIYFDTSLPYAEDSLFVTQYVMRKRCIGYVPNTVIYDYLKSGFSTVDKYANPVNSKDMLLIWAEKIIYAHIQDNNRIPKYVQGVLLNEFGWRWMGTKLFPVHLDEKMYQKWMEKFKWILSFIDSEILYEGLKKSKNWDSFILDKFSELKDTPIKAIPSENSIEYYQGNSLVRIDRNFEFFWTEIEIEDNQLKIGGFFKLHFGKHISPQFFYRNGSSEVSIESSESSYSYYRCKIKTHYFYKVEASIPIDELNDGDLLFGFYLDNYEFLSKKTFVLNNRLIPNGLGINRIVKSGYQFTFVDNHRKINIEKYTSDQSPWLDIQTVQKLKSLKKNELAKTLLDTEIDSSRKVWIYSDSSTALDNGFLQFKNDITKDDNVERYYLLHNRGSNIENEVIKQRIPVENLVYFGTEKHKKLFAISSCIVTGYQDTEIFSPFKTSDLNQLSGIFNLRVIYLQHGVLHAHMPRLLSYEKNRQIKGVVTSNDLETLNYQKVYGYKKSQLLEVGMPRFNNFSNDSENDNGNRTILYAPSWRSSVMIGKNIKGGWIPNEEAFLKSSFFLSIYSLVFSDSLYDILKSNDYTLDIKLHPIFSGVLSKTLNIKDNDRIRILDETESVSVKNYDLMVTDFSSFIFDAVEKQVPIIQFIPDFDEFTAGELHTYNKIESLSKKEIYKTVTNLDDFLKELTNMLNNEKYKKNYLMNMKDFFVIDSNLNEKIYSFILRLSGDRQLRLETFDIGELASKVASSDWNLLEQQFIHPEIGSAITPKKTLKIMKNPELTVSTNKSISKSQFFDVLDIVINKNGNPVIRTDGGFVSAFYSNYDLSYFPSKESLEWVHTQDYKFPLHYVALKSFETDNGVIDKGQILTAIGYKIENEKVYFVLDNKQKVTENNENMVLLRSDVESFVYRFNFSKVKLKHSLYVYNSVDFSETTRSRKRLLKYTTISVQGIEWTQNGTPRLKVKNGYISANLKNVSIIK
ncbi:glycosyltransferase [Enterococcus casseliflavus]|uniref:glycosyltransferase n=1 Tax=Enterococcus casseliflavus TaxID=37734 RepID=UPI001AD669CE|nr:glycosyltransferase [Enterococcus casseliflavus]MBO6359881.1 glycosyltransferase [Enterococcus casseliflavus]MBO6377725.1 glycosyltransferase [Enterococcus casseliflavus]